MGASSSSKRPQASKKFGTRELLSASMSAAVNLPTTQAHTSLLPRQGERASFMNHPMYLPPPPRPAISPKHKPAGYSSPNHLLRRQHHNNRPDYDHHVTSWNMHNNICSGKLYSPIGVYSNSRDNHHYYRQGQQKYHRHNIQQQSHRIQLQHQQLRQRSQRQGQQIGESSIDYGEGEDQTPQVSTRLKGATSIISKPGVAASRRLNAEANSNVVLARDGSAAMNGVGAVGGDVATKLAGKRSRMLAPPPAPLRSQSSSTLSQSESYGSRLEFCCCDECCALGDAEGLVGDGGELCYCNSNISNFSDRTTATANDYDHEDRDQGHQEYRIPALRRDEPLLQPQLNFRARRRRTRLRGSQEGCIDNDETAERRVARDERGENIVESDINNTITNENVNNNFDISLSQVGQNRLENSISDEATTCSAESASESQRQRPLDSLKVSNSDSISNNKENNSTTSFATQHRLAPVASSSSSSSSLSATTKTTTNMAATASSHLQNNNCNKQGSGTTTTLTNIPNEHKKPSLERGLAMDEELRKRHGLLGLLPAAVQDQDLQSKAVMNYIENCKDELSKYVYLRNLKDFNEKLFYYTLINNVQRLMPLVYTPTVGLACQKFSEIYMRPRGLFITANDAGRVRQIISNWPEKDVRVIVVTDGERILGLGDLGANGMGISIGKLSLYTSLAGIPPQNVLPVCIDVGTENEYNLKDPFYIGLRQHRLRGEKYDALIEEFMESVVERFGRSCLIQFEDFANSTAFNLLKRYRDRYCTFNDDIQGTASVSLSGLISAAKLTGKRLGDCSFLFYGAGEANLGTAQLLIMAMVEDGLKKEEAKKRIWLVDSKGLVVSSRQDLNEHKREFAQEVKPIKDLEAIVDSIKPTAMIGASAQGGSFTESICKKMSLYNDKPIIFALSNPTSKAECTADQAYRWTNGKCVFASGSPFDPVVYNGKTYITGQGNNAYIFPGVGLAAIGAHIHIVPEEAFIVAARALSDQVTPSDTEVGLVYPRLDGIREVTLKVAARVLEYLYAERIATYRPEPSNKMEFLRQIQYDPGY